MLLYDHFATKIELRRIVGRTACVRQQVTNRDAIPARRPFGKVPRDGIVERDALSLDQQHHRRCGELFAD